MQGQRPSTKVLYRNPSGCYIADDDDDACDRSLNDMEAGFPRDHRWSFVNGYLLVEEEEMRGETHFLDSCFLCEKKLGRNHGDIFMYRGDTPFCSKECREEQIQLEEQREMDMDLHSSMRSLWNKEQKQEGRFNAPSKSPDRRIRAGTVAVA